MKRILFEIYKNCMTWAEEPLNNAMDGDINTNRWWSLPLLDMLDNERGMQCTAQAQSRIQSSKPLRNASGKWVIVILPTRFSPAVKS